MEPPTFFKGNTVVAPRTTLRLHECRTIVTFLTTTMLLVSLSGCNDDIGTCCKALNEETRAKIPVPDENGGDRIRQDPMFDCSGLTCVSTAGSPTYCTRPCRSADDCPKGYTCEPVLQSDPGPGSTIGPDDQFCVSQNPDCSSTIPAE